jgi:hypothetical protein
MPQIHPVHKQPSALGCQPEESIEFPTPFRRPFKPLRALKWLGTFHDGSASAAESLKMRLRARATTSARRRPRTLSLQQVDR